MNFERNDYIRDPVVQSELTHDQANQIAEQQMDNARELAQVEYENGTLDDWISDSCDPGDTFKLAHNLVQWFSAIEAKEYDNLAWLEIVEKLLASLDPFALKDFKATIAHVIEQKAEMLRDEL